MLRSEHIDVTIHYYLMCNCAKLSKRCDIRMYNGHMLSIELRMTLWSLKNLTHERSICSHTTCKYFAHSCVVAGLCRVEYKVTDPNMERDGNSIYT